MQMTLGEIFARYGIVDEDSLELWLLRNSRRRREPRNGIFRGTGGEGLSFTDDLCNYYRRKFSSLRQGFYVPGIQQFTIAPTGRIANDDIRKALLTARQSTMLTGHPLEYFVHYSAGDGTEGFLSGRSFSSSWKFAGEFVRDSFKYRSLIDGSDLDILPKTLSYSSKEYPAAGDDRVDDQAIDFSEDLRLLDSLPPTRVIGVPASQQTIDAFLARYSLNHQPIMVHELYLPYIANVSLDHLIKLRAESHDELSQFQRAYHQALQEHIASSRSLDFARISEQIDADLIRPAVKQLQRKYDVIITQHRKMAAYTSAATLVPVGQLILSASSLKLLDPAMVRALFGSSSLLALALASNRASRKAAIDALQDDTYYIIWLAGRTRLRIVGSPRIRARNLEVLTK